MAHEGLAGFDVRAWFVVMGPGRTPKEIIARLNAEATKALQDAEFRSRVASLGIELVGGSPQQTDAFIRSEMVRWAKVIKAAGMNAN